MRTDRCQKCNQRIHYENGRWYHYQKQTHWAIPIQIQTIYWNWKWTYRNWFIFGILTLIGQIVLQNLQKLNNSFLPQIPLGSILIFALGILILKHMYGIVMWWIKYFDRYQATNLIIDVCGYLILLSVILSIPMEHSIQLPDASIQTKLNIPNTDNFTNSFNDLTKTINKVAIETKIKNPEIDDKWVLNFMTIVNNERVKKGLPTMEVSNQLNNIANIRFKKMLENPFISHYGADAYNVGEVVFYPDGFTEKNYVSDIQKNAYLHWDLLMYPAFKQYGFHVEEGPTIAVYEPCSVTEIPGANIDVKEFFSKQGCSTKVSNSVWLVIDMT